jgi:hypothetical protein
MGHLQQSCGEAQEDDDAKELGELSFRVSIQKHEAE